MRRTVTAVALAAVLTACGGQPEATPTEKVCDAFAAHVRDGMPQDDRAGVVAGIAEDIDGADEGLREAFPGLQGSVDAPDSTWKLAADVFAQRCFDAGWDG